MKRDSARRELSPQMDVDHLDQPPLNSSEYQTHEAGNQISGDSDRLNVISGNKRVHAVHGDVTRPASARVSRRSQGRDPFWIAHPMNEVLEVRLLPERTHPSVKPRL
jgi:hypothetical protein